MEIESLDQLDTLLTTGSTLCGLRLQGLDLCGHEQALLARTDAYAWSQEATVAHDAFVSMLRDIHDESMANTLDELLQGRRV